MDVITLADEDTVLGFNLAGVKHSIVFDQEKAKEQIAKCNSAKILIVTESIAKYLNDNNLRSHIKPVIVEVPDKSGSSGHALKEISKMFETAIGVKLK